MSSDAFDQLMTALYGSVSFEKGQRPDLDRLRALFHPNGCLAHATPDGVTMHTIASFIDAFEGNIGAGKLPSFCETEVHRRTSVFGAVAHITSVYEARHSRADSSPFCRGVNSIQLIRMDGEWKVLSIVWDDERPDNPIPPSAFTCE